ncbi:glycine radical domain-containing protein [Escherichia coli]
MLRRVSKHSAQPEGAGRCLDYSYQHVPYYGTNTPIDECYECGFTGEFECTSKGFTSRNVVTMTPPVCR